MSAQLSSYGTRPFKYLISQSLKVLRSLHALAHEEEDYIYFVYNCDRQPKSVNTFFNVQNDDCLQHLVSF
jgi:hypothetical protein